MSILFDHHVLLPTHLVVHENRRCWMILTHSCPAILVTFLVTRCSHLIGADILWRKDIVLWLELQRSKRGFDLWCSRKFVWRFHCGQVSVYVCRNDQNIWSYATTIDESIRHRRYINYKIASNMIRHDTLHASQESVLRPTRGFLYTSLENPSNPSNP